MNALKKVVFIALFSLPLMMISGKSHGQPAGCPTGTITNVSTSIDCSTAATALSPQSSSTSINTPANTNNVTTYDGLTVNIRQYTTINSNASTVGVASGSNVTNSGTLNAGNLNNGYGISFGANSRSSYGGNTVINTSTGEINTIGPNADGIAVIARLSTSTGNSISNYGRISTIGNGSYGISLDTRSTNLSVTNTILNSGSITTTGNASSASTADGIYVNDVRKIVSITNTSTGSIRVTGAGANAITVNGAASILNSGSISASSGLAINFTGSIPTGAFNSLTINNGSSIVGGISFNTSSTQETLTFNGYESTGFNNAITGLNIINATNSTNVVMNSLSGYDLVSGQISVDDTSSLKIDSVVRDQISPASVASISKTGAGTLTLTGTNTYTGNTTLNAGTIAVGNNSALGTGSLAMATGTTLQAASSVSLANSVGLTGTANIDTNGNNLGLSGVISGSGSLNKIGAGTLTLTAANTYAGGTTLNAGTIAVGNNSALGTGSLAMATGATLQAASSVSLANAMTTVGTATVDTNGNNLGLSGAITGAGSLTKIGLGTLTLAGINTYSGGTTVSAGTLAGNAASLQGNIDNSGIVQFTQSAAGTYAGVMSGTGDLVKTGAGTLTLTGTNTYTGNTTLNAGTIAVGNNSALGTGSLAMATGTTLQAASSVSLANSVGLTGTANIDTNGNNLGLSGVISGSGSLNKIGAGTLTLTAANTYSGDTNINAGSVVLTGSTTSNTNIASGATLQGSGVINGNLTNTGIVAPSFNSAQTNLTVNGNYVGNNGLFIGSVYGPVTAPVADTLTVTGNTSGNTGVTITDRGGLGNRTTGNGIPVIIVNGTSISNAFALNQRVAAGAYEYQLYKGGASGTGNSWYLSTQAPAQETNSGSSGGSTPVIETPSVPILTPAAGERIEVAVYPAVPSLLQLYAQTAVDTLDQRRGDLNLADPQGGAKKSSNDWGRIIGKTGTSTPSNVDNGPRISFNAYALQLGVDVYQNEEQGGSRTYLGPYITIGSANANTSSQTSGIATGSINGMQAYSFGLYGTHFASNGLYVDALAQGTRYLNAGAGSVQGAQLRTQGSGFTGSIEGGGRWNVDKFLISPQAQIVYDAIGMNNATDAYGQVNFNKSELTRGRLGLLAGHKDVVGSTPIFAYLRASYWSVFNAGTSTSFASLYGVNPITFQSQANSNWMTIDAELNARITRNTNLFINLAVDNSLVGTYQAYSGRIGLQTRF